MNYKGKLYMQLAGEFVDSGKTSDDWDTLTEQLTASKKECESLRDGIKKAQRHLSFAWSNTAEEASVMLDKLLTLPQTPTQ